MPKVLVIRNPRSGRQAKSCAWPNIQNRISRMFPGVLISETTGPGHAGTLAREAVLDQFQLVIAVGGDGTIHEVANQLVGTETSLGIIPSGTGNDLCRTLSIGPSIDSALETLRAGKKSLIDVGEWCSGESGGHFVNIAGTGFDAAVADRINLGFRSLRGTSAYLAATVSTLARYKPKRVRLTFDDKTIEREVMLVAFANAKFYGGGMKVAPDASVTDGLLDVIVVNALSKPAFLRSFPSVFKGEHIHHPAVECFRVGQVTVDCPGTSQFLVDGELQACSQVQITVKKACLRVIAGEV